MVFCGCLVGNYVQRENFSSYYRCLCKLDTLKVLAMLCVMEDFTGSWRLVHANRVPSLRYLNTTLTKNVGLKIFDDMQIPCKTTFLITSLSVTIRLL